MGMFSSIFAIVSDLQEKWALVTPHVVQNIRGEISSHRHHGDQITDPGWFTGFDALKHLLIFGHAPAQMLGQVDNGVTAIG